MMTRAASISALAFLVAACGASDPSAGAGTGGLRSDDRDRAAPECTDGDTRPSSDGCPTCTCIDGAWACPATLDCPGAACAAGDPPPPTDRCTACACEAGRWVCRATPCPPPECEDGDVKDADDGCNTCACADGTWACTEMACPPPECETDADCIRTGCSGHICAPTSVASTCEWLPEYACYADANCGCVDGVCAFGPADALQACIDDARGS